MCRQTEKNILLTHPVTLILVIREGKERKNQNNVLLLSAIKDRRFIDFICNFNRT